MRKKYLWLSILVVMLATLMLVSCPAPEDDPGLPVAVDFSMIDVEGKTFYISNDNATAQVSDNFQVGETEVAYELWHAVYAWATHSARGDGRYYFQNTGCRGSLGTGSVQQPVTVISWRDALVFCNAITEWKNALDGSALQPVYTYDTAVIRDSRDANATACDNPVVNTTADGYRLPSANEWELAARYIDDANDDGDITDAGEYYPYNYASGATADTSDETATRAVAYYWDDPAGNNTHPVGEKNPNALGCYDMSGNVWEFCFDLTGVDDDRMARGGSWYNDQVFLLRVSMYVNTHPSGIDSLSGLRLFRTQ